MTELQREINKSNLRLIVGDFNVPLATIDFLKRKKNQQGYSRLEEQNQPTLPRQNIWAIK